MNSRPDPTSTIKLELTDYEAEVLMLAVKKCAADMEAHGNHTTTPSFRKTLLGDAKMLREIHRDLGAERELLPFKNLSN